MALKAARNKINPVVNRYKILGTNGISASSVVEELTSFLQELDKLDTQTLNSPNTAA